MHINNVFANYWVHIGSIIGSFLKPQTSLKTSHFLFNDAMYDLFQFLTIQFFNDVSKKAKIMQTMHLDVHRTPLPTYVLAAPAAIPTLVNELLTVHQ